MQFRDHSAVVGKRDFYPIDPRQIKIDPNYNVRDLTTPEAIAELQELKNSIIENGVVTPIRVRLDGKDIILVRGHRRLAATMLAIAEGHDIKAINAEPEPKGTNELDRIYDLGLSNDQVPLNPLEFANIVKKALNFGQTPAQIAKRLAKSPAVIEYAITLLSAGEDVKAMVRSGEVSATTAARIVKAEGSKAGATLKAAGEVAKAAGKAKITAKSIKKVTGEFDATPTNVRRLIQALQFVAKNGDGKVQNRAIETLTALNLPTGSNA
jgi:ParB family chromosome partitioning protein